MHHDVRPSLLHHELLVSVVNIRELTLETLSQKNCRLMQERCKHDEVYSSTVNDGPFTNCVCLNCGKWWRAAS